MSVTCSDYFFHTFITLVHVHEYNVCLYLCGGYIYIPELKEKRWPLPFNCLSKCGSNSILYKITWLCVSTSNKTPGSGWQSLQRWPLLVHVDSKTIQYEPFSTSALKCMTTPPSYIYFPFIVSSRTFFFFFEEGFKIIYVGIYIC